ncbi:helix-turn-helix domain-containing protein [Lysinibacillus piscis]|uniref:Transcriptional regulator n=1 Tax=Lysinibacillus piscis TaxID=2518931 RepID=A0ABQ5NHD3_9BACI|nr:XRE family transcriptional regulator [Lysinibacillus sp. KH24]GLC87765.1 transcriptional regulator [Lysinibacillus sp. KH24]
MEQMSRNLAFQLKKIRQQRQWSLDEVAKTTGVSKAQLAQIEKGEANPTVSTIWKIAAGLRISFSSLLQPPTAHFMKYSSENAPYVDEDDGRYRVYSLIPYSPERGWELYKVEMKPGALRKSEAHTEGVEETITVIQGQAIIATESMLETLEEGDTLVFSGHQPHEYRNASNDVTILHLILQYK